ncbi:MAG TPA: hypothetical protein VFH31_05585, partial [Pyrinomonadaceae bacterium]|nr:hypothetical protein [Pyrinomonadaceae bacterium]
MKSRKITTILLVTCLSITSLSFASVPYAKSESVKLRKITPTFDFNAIKKPVVGRIEISANRLNSTRVHVPAGTRAYLAGTFGGNKPALLAWYDGETKRLIAAVELHVGKNAVPTEDGVEVNAAAGDGGKAAALVTIKTTKKMPALLEPEGAVMLRTSSDAESYPVAPLLSFEGSSHLLTLSQPLPNEVLQSDKFDVRVQNLTGETIFSQKLVANGNVPSRIHVATTRTGKSSRVEVINSGSEDKLVALKPETQNVTWSDTNSSETRTVEVSAGGTASPGSLVSQIPGVFPLKYSEQTIGHPQNDLSRVGNWAEGPSVVSEDGNTILTGLCDSPVTEARTDTPSSARITPVNATDQPRVQNGRSSSNHRSLFAMGVSGLSGAGTLAVLLTNRKGEKHEEQVSYVPISSVGLADETSVVEIVPTSSTGFLLTEACGFQDE